MAKTSDEQNNSAADQYNAAFDEEPQGGAQPSEDEAFGITPPVEAVAAAAADNSADGDGLAGDAVEHGENGGSAAGEVDQNSGGTQEPEDPKEVQRLKSWEGRLKKLEAELRAKGPVEEAGAVEALENTSEQAEASGDDALGEAAEQVAEQVEDGSMTVEQAMKQLADDFGEPFVKMIEAIASAKASAVGGQAVSDVKQEVQDIISHISDASERSHFEKIESAVPDFNELRQSEAFKAFVQASPEVQKIASGGSAAEVIAMLKDFKAQSGGGSEQQPEDAGQSDPEGADAAAGVRSGGLRLPAEPVDDSDYAGAFEEASRLK